MTKETFYFSHDYNSRTDEKIKNLIRKHGMTGYGIFWCIIEDLYNNANALRMDIEGIAYEYRVPENIITSILKDFDLFVFNEGNFGSLSVQRRIDERNKKSITARKSAFKRWGKDANAMQTQCERIDNLCESNAIKNSIVKEKKEKKEKIYREFAHLKIFVSEFDKLILDGYSKAQIDSVLDSIQNYKKNTSYVSLYLTAKKWLNKEHPSISATSSQEIKLKYYTIPNEYLMNFSDIELKQMCKEGKFKRI